jgi:hypothetical protein
MTPPTIAQTDLRIQIAFYRVIYLIFKFVSLDIHGSFIPQILIYIFIYCRFEGSVFSKDESRRVDTTVFFNRPTN